MIQEQSRDYSDGTTEMIGLAVWDDAAPEPVPGVLIAPAFGGRGPVEEEWARRLVAAGYAVLVADYYGGGKRANDRTEAQAWMAALNADRPTLTQRMQAALESLRAMEAVDPTRVAAIGFCLGGKAALDLARSGTVFQACATLHGVYDAPAALAERYSPAILILHGWDDPLATPAQLTELAEELTARSREWQVLGFGHTGHAFTNPAANAPGMSYSAAASARAWDALMRLFQETLHDPA
ncbi:MAG: dienelactone hydrolase family protein [Pseudomonadota bacterium]